MNDDCLKHKMKFVNQIKESGYYKCCEKNEYTVSVLVTSYNPNEEKLFVTLNSCLVQKNIDLQIVITDDGSEYFNLKKMITFFELNHFHDYVITVLNSNKGTVKNVANGLKYCQGKYTKTISPGDYLYGCDCLEKWVLCIEKSLASISFGDCIHYVNKDRKIQPISVIANPQAIKKFYNNSWAYNYLIFDDLVTGACMLTDTEKLREYITLIEDKVFYAEDNIYRLMAFNEENACYFDRIAVLYEHGTGISTGGDTLWMNRLQKDWIATNTIILSLEKDSSLSKMFKFKQHFYNDGHLFGVRKIKKYLGYILINGLFYFLLKRKIHPRYTTTQIDSNYVSLIHKNRELYADN